MAVLLLIAQSFVPGQSLSAICSGQWVNLANGGATIAADCVEPPPPPSVTAIVVDHTSLALFDLIPPAYLDAARALRLMWVDQSVGYNQHEGLNCLAVYPPSSLCKKQHVLAEWAVPASELFWSQAYPRPNWVYYGWPGFAGPPPLPQTCSAGDWAGLWACFRDYVDAHPADYDVFAWQFSYLQVDSGSTIADPAIGFTARFSDDLRALQGREQIVLSTSSLARSIGTAESTDFNAQLRVYVQANGGYLLDVADIESHDPWGNPCYDNRDGVPYSAANGSQVEDYPDDGLNVPAICQHYTSEADGGHLGTGKAGQIRLAKAWWVLMAQIAGWRP